MFPLVLSNGPKPLLLELTSTAVAPALLAPKAQAAVKASEPDVELSARQAGGFLYVIAVRRGATTSQVTFSELPTGVGGGQALFEYVHQEFRTVEVAGGSFRDWLGPHDARVLRHV